MDDATWAALTLVLTLMGGGWTWYAFRNRGITAGIRGAALTLLPPAAYLTGTLEAGVRIVDVVADWGSGLVFSPSVWFGMVLLGISVTLYFLANLLGARGKGGAEPKADQKKAGRKKAGRKQKVAPAELATPPTGRGKPVIDDDLAEIEAILKKRGIS
jgi:hypothetical protein